jgi:hypothetical protein
MGTDMVMVMDIVVTLKNSKNNLKLLSRFK